MPEEEVQTEATGEETPATTTAEPTAFDWRSSLPDDIREDPSLQTIHGENEGEIIAALSKQHINAQRAMGRDKIALPGKNASDEEVREYYTRIGCPETPDGYTAPTEGVSDKFDTDLFDSAREEAHRLGVRPDQLAVGLHEGHEDGLTVGRRCAGGVSVHEKRIHVEAPRGGEVVSRFYYRRS